MRACVLAFALIAIAPPAFARDHSHHSSRHLSRHHHAHAHHGSARHHLRRENSWSHDEGMVQPQVFARTDAAESPFVQQSWNAPERIVTRVARMPRERASHSALDSMIARHAAANGLPVELVHRVVARESGYNPGARNRSGATGLMQIKPATARGMGYAGSASGLLDAETNLTYAVKYLAGAYRAAGGNAGRAVAYYQSGYHGRGEPRIARRAAHQVASLAPAVVPAPDSASSTSRADDMRTTQVALNAEIYVAPEAGARVHRRHRR